MHDRFKELNTYIPGQRWVSNTESELGLGLILEADLNRITVLYPACGEQRTYSRKNAPLTRVAFLAGDNIEAADNQQLTVCKVIEKNGLLAYVSVDKSGKARQLDEIDLNHHIQFNKPQDRFFTGQIDPGEWFLLRYETWQNLQRLQQSPVRGLLGSRSALIPHQIYIAHEAAGRFAPRIMLADEVGLGKTIEAGLILHHRLINGLTQRALIIVPETLLHQWLVEMLRRFNLHFSIFDEQRCAAVEDENPFLSEQLILCSQNFITANPKRQQQALQADWDMVIVDEAHHLQWNEQNPSPEYRFIEQLAGKTSSLILLTATPEQLGEASHFARLRLLDPDRYYSFGDFIEEQRDFAPVATAARLLLAGKPLDSHLQQLLKGLLKREDAENLLEQINAKGATPGAAEELLNLLLDHHGTGRILFRNSRQTVQGFPKRQLFSYPLNAPYDVTKQQSSQLEGDPLFLWLIEKIQQLGEQKALLICEQAQTVLDLAQGLKKVAGIRAAVFHEGMSIVKRDRAAAWFADPESKAQVLICSEIGSEGRNFQFAHHLILFDLPCNPGLLQQRIGRLDRIGQQHIIQIHVPYYLNSTQHTLFRWYDEGFDAFRHNCSAAERVYILQQSELSVLLQNHDQAAIDTFISQTKQLSKNIEAELHEGRDQLLELNSCRKQDAAILIEQLNELSQRDGFWSYMDRLFDCYGVDVDFHSQDCHILKPGNHLRIAHFPELPEDGITITVDRDIALVREDMQFLTWEHPMATAAMDLVLSSETGNAAVSIVKHKQLDAGRFFLEALYIIECSAPTELQLGRYLPPTPVRVLIDEQGVDVTDHYPYQSFLDVRRSMELTLIANFLIEQKQHINNMLDVAAQAAQRTRVDVIGKSSKMMLDVLTREIKRMVRLKKVNANIKDQEIEHLKKVTQACHENIQAAQLRLDAVRLIITDK